MYSSLMPLDNAISFAYHKDENKIIYFFKHENGEDTESSTIKKKIIYLDD